MQRFAWLCLFSTINLLTKHSRIFSFLWIDTQVNSRFTVKIHKSCFKGSNKSPDYHSYVRSCVQVTHSKTSPVCHESQINQYVSIYNYVGGAVLFFYWQLRASNIIIHDDTQTKTTRFHLRVRDECSCFYRAILSVQAVTNTSSWYRRLKQGLPITKKNPCCKKLRWYKIKCPLFAFWSGNFTELCVSVLFHPSTRASNILHWAV